MKKRKGFTIVELLAVLLILSVIIILTMTLINTQRTKYTNVIKNSKIKTIEIAAEKYGNANINAYQLCVGNKENLGTICKPQVDEMVETLVNYGYLDSEDISVDPNTNDSISGELAMCYNATNQTVTAKYVSINASYECGAGKLDYLYLSSISGTGFKGSSIYTNIMTNKTNATYKYQASPGITLTFEREKLKIFVGQNVENGDYAISIIQNETNMMVTYNLTVKDMVFEIDDSSVGSDNFICIQNGQQKEISIKVENNAIVEINNNEYVSGDIDNNKLIINALNPGRSTLSLVEKQSLKTIDLTTNVFSFEELDAFPKEMFVGEERTVSLNLNGIDNLDIRADSSLIRMQETDSENTSFKIKAIAPGTAIITISGFSNGHSCFEKTFIIDIKMVDLNIVTTSADLYVGGNSFVSALETNYMDGLTCESSDPEAVQCEVNNTSVKVSPGSKEARNVVVYVKAGNYDYATKTINVDVYNVQLNVYDSNDQNVTSPICRNVFGSQNEKDVHIYSKNAGNISVTNSASNSQYCIAKVDYTDGVLTLEPRTNIYEFDSGCRPYANNNTTNSNKNTGKVKVTVTEDSMNRRIDFFYQIYYLYLSEDSGTVSVGSTHTFDIYYSYLGDEIDNEENENSNYVPEITSNDTGIATVSVGTPSIYSSHSGDSTHQTNTIKKVRVSVRGISPGATQIKIKGKYCGEATYEITSKGVPSCPNISSSQSIYDGNGKTVNGNTSASFGTAQFSVDGGSYSENRPYATSVGVHTVDVKVKGFLFFSDRSCPSVNISIRNSKVTFNNDTSGTFSGSNILYTRYGTDNLYNGEYSNTVVEKSNYPKIEKVGYDFNGWYKESSTINKIIDSNGAFVNNTDYTNSDGKWNIASDVNLYAKISVQKYTLSFDANGGINAPSSMNITYGTPYNLPSSEPTREHYEFLGWSTNPNATSATYGSGEENMAIYGSSTQGANPGSFTLYAVWKQLTYKGVAKYKCPNGTYQDSSNCTTSGVSTTRELSKLCESSGTSNNCPSVSGCTYNAGASRNGICYYTTSSSTCYQGCVAAGGTWYTSSSACGVSVTQTKTYGTLSTGSFSLPSCPSGYTQGYVNYSGCREPYGTCVQNWTCTEHISATCTATGTKVYYCSTSRTYQTTEDCYN